LRIVYSDKCLRYREFGHPESPERVYNAYRLLVRVGFDFVEPEPCSEGDLRLVHDLRYIERIKSGRFLDSDSPNLPGIYNYARLSAGGAIKAMELALEGEVAFSLMRPPGHHAGRNGRALGASSLGFCYFNNVAVASVKALGSVDRVAILDIDCHHGNGTEEIVYGNPRILFISLHKFGFIYPGTGGESRGNCINYPLSHNATEDDYMEALHSALRRVEEFKPELLAISAGFDTYRLDPLCGLGLSKEAYLKIGRLISRLNVETFAVLEGGYSRDMPECIHNFLRGLEGK